MHKTGIICEYNPFHNGHAHHIRQTKSALGGDVVCVMSGDFVQRAEPAISDKRVRTEAALTAGADAVIELPTLYATAGAEQFAYGAIEILRKIDGVKHLSFGVETDDTQLLEFIAELQYEETADFSENVKTLLREGKSYPAALAAATAAKAAPYKKEKEVLAVLGKPNNLLAIEYLKAIKRSGADIKPFFVRRTDGGYNSDALVPPFASASALRKQLDRNGDISDFIPNYHCKKITDDKVFSTLARAAILNDKRRDDEISLRLYRAAQKHSDIDEIISAAKSKHYTYARLKRQVLYTMLDIDSGLFEFNGVFYAKLLGIKKSFTKKLKDLPDNILIKNTDENRIVGVASDIYNIDKRASNLYSVITSQDANRFYKNKLTII